MSVVQAIKPDEHLLNALVFLLTVNVPLWPKSNHLVANMHPVTKQIRFQMDSTNITMSLVYSNSRHIVDLHAQLQFSFSHNIVLALV